MCQLWALHVVINRQFFYIYICSFSTKFILLMYTIAQAYLRCCSVARTNGSHTGIRLVVNNGVLRKASSAAADCNAPDWSVSLSHYIVPREKLAPPCDAAFRQNFLITYYYYYLLIECHMLVMDSECIRILRSTNCARKLILRLTATLCPPNSFSSEASDDASLWYAIWNPVYLGLFAQTLTA